MKKEKPLTIDVRQTASMIRADGRTPASWARMRGIPRGTITRLMAGKYPYIEDTESRYQQVLQALRDDGYLVEEHRDANAA